MSHIVKIAAEVWGALCLISLPVFGALTWRELVPRKPKLRVLR